MEKDNRSQESSLRSSTKGGSSSGRPVIMEAGDRSRKGNSSQSQLNVGETKADAWETAEMEKLNKR